MAAPTFIQQGEQFQRPPTMMPTVGLRGADTHRSGCRRRAGGGTAARPGRSHARATKRHERGNRMIWIRLMSCSMSLSCEGLTAHSTEPTANGDGMECPEEVWGQAVSLEQALLLEGAPMVGARGGGTCWMCTAR